MSQCIYSNPRLLDYKWRLKEDVKSVRMSGTHSGSDARMSSTLTLRAESQCAQMSKITNDNLTQSAPGCFTAVLIWQQWASTG